ncbi:hypothetical protein ACN4EG_08590 [Alkalinema pantanalense CENA528]|uniref:hypothetical protein n=1 Tax=Alkalinema pantanalense TaxID=1620705 RepID=UPI003D6E0E51
MLLKNQTLGRSMGRSPGRLGGTLGWVSCAIVTVCGIASGRPALSTTLDSFCFMQSPTGQWVNLDRLCNPMSPSSSTTEKAAAMQVRRLRYNGATLQGEVVNQTGLMVKRFTINYTIVDRNGKEITTSFITQQGNFQPGVNLPFATTRSIAGASAKITSVEWAH